MENIIKLARFIPSKVKGEVGLRYPETEQVLLCPDQNTPNLNEEGIDDVANDKVTPPKTFEQNKELKKVQNSLAEIYFKH